MDDLRFDAQAVIVTGGCRGIGLGIAQRFAAAGAHVLVACRNVPESLPAGVAFTATDVREPEQVDALMGDCIERFGRLDVLVNNVGGSPPADSATASPRFTTGIIGLNLTAPIVCAQKANAVMQSQEHGGSIVNIASVSGVRASPNTLAYGAAKAGLLNATKTMAVEFAPKVRVNAVVVGLVVTEQAHLFYGDEAGIAAVGATVPLGRMAEPADIADVCLFLASPLARYVTGAEVLVHGGGERPAYMDAARDCARLMRTVVFGIGAVGGVIAGRLFEHGNDVLAIARGAHYEAVRDGGLRLVDPDREATLRLPVVDAPARVDWRDDDVVLVTTKTQDATGAFDALVAVAGPDVSVVCVQNGVANERIALRRFRHVHAICVMLPAEHLEPGVVAASSAPVSGLLDIGRYPSGVDAVDEEVAAALSAATFESIPRPDIMRWKYRKLLMNLANAVEALCAPGDDAIELSRLVRREGTEVLRVAGIAVASMEEDRERRGDRLTPRLARGGGSTWQSLRRGTGSLETDYLNGEIALLARLHGTESPVNEMLQIAAADAARRRLAPGSLRASDLLKRVVS